MKLNCQFNLHDYSVRSSTARAKSFPYNRFPISFIYISVYVYFFSFRLQFLFSSVIFLYFGAQILSVHMWKNYLQKSQVCSLPRDCTGGAECRALDLRGFRVEGVEEWRWTFLNDACKLYADRITLAPADGMCNCRLPAASVDCFTFGCTSSALPRLPSLGSFEKLKDLFLSSLRLHFHRANVFRSNGYVVAVCQLSLHQTLNGGPATGIGYRVPNTGISGRGIRVSGYRAPGSGQTCRILLTTTLQIRQSNQHCVNNKLCVCECS